MVLELITDLHLYFFAGMDGKVANELVKGFPKIIETVLSLIMRSHYDLHERS